MKLPLDFGGHIGDAAVGKVLTHEEKAGELHGFMVAKLSGAIGTAGDQQNGHLGLAAIDGAPQRRVPMRVACLYVRPAIQQSCGDLNVAARRAAMCSAVQCFTPPWALTFAPAPTRARTTLPPVAAWHSLPTQ